MPAQELQSALSFVETKVTVKGKTILFKNLSVHEYLADTGSFSFNWRQPLNTFSIKDHISFYGENLGAEVEISIGNSFTFKGIIFSIGCNNQDDLSVEYEISGKGLPAKLEEGVTCASYLKKTLKDIAEAAVGRSVKHQINPEYTEVLYYTVQYNQSAFDFLKLLAARYGEWLFFDGTQIRLGKPDNGNIELVANSTLNDWQLSGKMLKQKAETVSTDMFTGLNLKMEDSIKGLKGIYKSVADAGEKSISGVVKKHSTKNVQEKLLKSLSQIQLQGDLANSVYVSGSSYAVELRLCTVVEVKLYDNTDQGKYRVTEVHHRSNDGSDYYNSFTAIPIEAEKPPYTNTELFPIAMAQPAEVSHNEDKDGLDRVKVKFPWQSEDQTSPWIAMVQPHAGKNKGFRFMPEIGDKVMVGFLDDNAERPFVLGTLYNENEKSGIGKDEKNEKKFIGTKTGRRLLWDEGKSLMALNDNVFGFPSNQLVLSRKEGEESVKISSGKSEKNGSIIEMKNEETMEIGMLRGGSLIAKIIFDSKEEKITIESDGPIEIKSKKSIKMEAPDIEIKAQKKVKIEGTSDVEVGGANIKINADAALEAKGTSAVFEGTAKADFKAGGIASLSGAMVKIN